MPVQMTAAMRREVLRQVPLFRTLTPGEVDAIAAHAATHSYPRGNTILRKGDPASAMLIVLQGRVRVGITAADGREVSFRIMGPGEIIGELSLLDGQERSADVQALEASVLLAVEREHFLLLLRNSADLCLRLMSVLCDKLRRSTVSLEEAMLLNLSGRLWRHLQRMASEHGIVTPEGTRINIRLSQSELAALIGASREKVNRQLKSWESQGVIRQDGGYIILPDGLRPA